MTPVSTLSALGRDFLREMASTGSSLTQVFDFNAIGAKIGITEGVTIKAVRELTYAKLIAYVHEPGDGVLTHSGRDLGFTLRRNEWNRRRRNRFFRLFAKCTAAILGGLAVGYLLYLLRWN